MAESIVSTVDLSRFKCTNCNNYLSHYPIYLTVDSNICGRCPTPRGSLRNEAFEKIASTHKFPCRYQSKGCFKEVIPQKMPRHEKLCRKREVICYRTDCNHWRGVICNVAEHYTTFHQDISKGSLSFIIDSLRTRQKYLLGLVILEDKTFCVLFKCHFVNENGVSGLFIFEGIENERDTFECDLTLNVDGKQEERKYSVVLPYSKKVFCLSTAHQSKSLQGTLKFTTNNQSLEEQNLKLMERLKCNSEKSDDSVDLNKISVLLNYPCHFQERGCNSFFNSLEMINHINVCNYSEMECFFQHPKCTWKAFRKDLSEHILTCHIISEIAYFHISDIHKHPQGVCQVIKFDAEIFLVKVILEKTEYKATVQKISNIKDNYKFEIVIIHANRSKIIIEKKCSIYTGLNYSFDDKDRNFQMETSALGDVLGGVDDILFQFRVLE